MTCSVYKSNTHNKRKCPDKDKVLPPPAKRGRGRPRSNATAGEEIGQNTISTTHHGAIAQPIRLGRNGRVIRSVRGGRGTTRGAGRGNRGGRGKAPQGVGILIDEQGNVFTNPLGNQYGPRMLPPVTQTLSQPTQASVNQRWQRT